MSIEMTNGLVEMGEVEMETVVGGLRSWNQVQPSPLVTPEYLPKLLTLARGNVADLCSASPGRQLVTCL